MYTAKQEPLFPFPSFSCLLSTEKAIQAHVYSNWEPSAFFFDPLDQEALGGECGVLFHLAPALTKTIPLAHGVCSIENFL